MAKRRSKRSRDPGDPRAAGEKASGPSEGASSRERAPGVGGPSREGGRAAGGHAGQASGDGGGVPGALVFVLAVVGLWIIVPLVSWAYPDLRLLTSSGQDLPDRGLVQVGFALWAAAAAVGLARRAAWGWWLATVLAVFQMLSNLLGAVLSDVVTGDVAGARELVLAGAGIRLVLWLAVGLVLHGHRLTLHFELPWAREEERRRSSRVFTYAVSVLAVLYVLSRYLFGPGQ